MLNNHVIAAHPASNRSSAFTRLVRCVAGATFEENLYGWRRRLVSPGGATAPPEVDRLLPPRSAFWSFMGAVLAPYVEARLASAAQDPANDVDDGDDESVDDEPLSLSDRIERGVAASGRWMSRQSSRALSAYRLLKLGYLLAFATGHTPYASPWFHLSRTRLTKLTTQDEAAMLRECAAREAAGGPAAARLNNFLRGIR